MDSVYQFCIIKKTIQNDKNNSSKGGWYWS